MFAVLFVLVFQYLAKRLAEKVYKITYFVSVGM